MYWYLHPHAEPDPHPALRAKATAAFRHFSRREKGNGGRGSRPPGRGLVSTNLSQVDR
jgi:hypothetical protein